VERFKAVKIIKDPLEMSRWSREVKAGGETIGFVPTMGFFHDGHLALMRAAGEKATRVVVSLFVNPIQFGPGEDYDRYPRDFDRDASMAEGQGVDLLFAPDSRAMYPEGEPLTRVTVRGLTEGLCGRSRPGHFDGVTTVVTKLFHLVRPHFAVFGRKDLQQLAVIRRMVQDLDFGVEIVPHPVVREPDGLAMSSRNTYLDEAGRRSALSLYAALRHAVQRVKDGIRDTALLGDEVREILQKGGVAVEYIEFVDEETLASHDRVSDTTVLALAGRVGATRLIDNHRLSEPL